MNQLKYLKGNDLKIKLAGKDITLSAPLCSDFDLLSPILRSYGSTNLDTQVMKGQAVMALADRLIDRAKLTPEQIAEIQAYLIAFYFAFGVELDLYLPALFPPTEQEPAQGQGDDTPLRQNDLSSSSAIQ